MLRATRVVARRLNLTTVPASKLPSYTPPAALSPAYVGKLPERWGNLPQADRAQLIADLKSRMLLDWQELTPAEKKAAYYISFGEWGPRKPLHGPGDAAKVFWGVTAGIAASVVLYAIVLSFATPDPVSLNREWQEKSDEYLKEKNANPFTGYSQIQSK